VVVSVWNLVLQGWNVVAGTWNAVIFQAIVDIDKQR